MVVVISIIRLKYKIVMLVKKIMTIIFKHTAIWINLIRHVYNVLMAAHTIIHNYNNVINK